jgi:hypothetical protein
MRTDHIPLEIWETIIEYALTPRWHTSEFPKLPPPAERAVTLMLVCKGWQVLS